MHQEGLRSGMLMRIRASIFRLTNNRALHFTDGLTEWVVILGGFIRSILVLFFRSTNFSFLSSKHDIQTQQ